jgi:hypothetical protein
MNQLPYEIRCELNNGMAERDESLMVFSLQTCPQVQKKSKGALGT